MKPSTSHTFRIKEDGAPDTWRVAIYPSKLRGLVMAYATGPTAEKAEENATLIVAALSKAKSVK